MSYTDPVKADQSKYTDDEGNLRYSADKSLVFPGPTGVRSTPQFEVGDRCFSHYTMKWGTIERVGSTNRERYHHGTGKPEDRMDDTTWYDVRADDGSVDLLDDAHGHWEMARIVPPAIASRYGYGTDPKETS